MIFGENSGSAIVIISASSSQIGTIIHTNQEIEQVLGYKRKELIGRNVNCLMPRVIGKAHDLTSCESVSISQRENSFCRLHLKASPI